MGVRFHSNGKLLISAEYAVLDGALALAVPTVFGQDLHIAENTSGILRWKSYDADGSCWFQGSYQMVDFSLLETSDSQTGKALSKILVETARLSSGFLRDHKGGLVETHLTFPRKWGLGTSSTLINNIAQWAGVDPYTLLKNTFGGSGYDIACARHNGPLHYQLFKGRPIVTAVDFKPSFQDGLYFVYLNKKQDSREAIMNYRNQVFDQSELIGTLSDLTLKMTTTDSLGNFGGYMARHEAVLSKVLRQPPIKERLFPDYFGSIKSLGGWGGDFILVTGNEKTPGYFKAKGFDTILSYAEMLR